MEGIRQAINNLNSISFTAVPVATAQAVNRVAARVVSRSIKRVAGETRLQQKLIRQRVRLRRAGSKQSIPNARLLINRGNLPAIAVGSAKVQLSRKRHSRKGRGSVLKIGRFTFKDAFIQQLSNGRWHVLQRTGHGRYPLEVVKISLVTPLTRAFTAETETLLQSDMPKELVWALKNQLRLYIKRRV
ncbi:phage tail protein [Morganella psychrotolerans]|uniref:Phage tail protein n=1 Tax=Morganella psychrotolerans TaxID=368603 RepID=A0A5M9R8W9_9GAMM|nr:phage tail protein [Morganella psychrotolerans]KAA8716707.1 phage tail protein [Morganella psychrotolerans]OBU08928.1 phage tail protein [Morganella psychrotolerans]